MKPYFRSYPKRLLLLLGVALVCFIGLMVGFVELVDEIREGSTTQFDESVLLAINEQSTPLLDALMRGVTDFGSIGVAVATVIGVIIYAVKRRVYKALFLAVAVGGAGVLNAILKLLFERQRPDLWEQLITEATFSFPSGHAMASSALAFGVILLFWRTKYRWFVLAVAVIYTVVIGVSRLYLGVHYPTDIVGGWLMSAAWVMLTASIFWHRHVLHLAKPLPQSDDTTK